MSYGAIWFSQPDGNELSTTPTLETGHLTVEKKIQLVVSTTDVQQESACILSATEVSGWNTRQEDSAYCRIMLSDKFDTSLAY